MFNIIISNLGQEQVNTVDAKQLYEFLEVSTRFNDWIVSKIEQYGFVENQDFISFTENSVKPQGGRPTKDYRISLDMAKELSMVERNAKGKEARQYFIECERQAKTAPVSNSIISDEKIKNVIETRVKVMNGKIATLKETTQKTIQDYTHNKLTLMNGQIQTLRDDTCKGILKIINNSVQTAIAKMVGELTHIAIDTVVDDFEVRPVKSVSQLKDMVEDGEINSVQALKEEFDHTQNFIKQTLANSVQKIPPQKQQSFKNDARRSDHAIDTAVGIIAAQHTFNSNCGRAVMPAYYITNKQVIWTIETPKHATWIHALRALGRLVIDDTYMFNHINGLCATSIQNLQRVKTLSIVDAFKFTDIEITKTECNQIIDPAYIAPYGIRVNLTQKMEHLLSDYDSIKQWADDAVTCPGGMTTGESVFIPADVFLIACIYTEYSAPKDYNFYGNVFANKQTKSA